MKTKRVSIKIISLAFMSLLLCCDLSAAEAEESMDARIETYLNQMTLEEKVAQMFVVLPDAFLGVDTVTMAGEVTQSAVNDIPVGGFTYLAQNLQSESQIKDMLSDLQEISIERIGLPMFTCVDEEGGTVARINGRGILDVPYIGNMSDVGLTGDAGQARWVGSVTGEYLSELGFNVNFAPVADVLTNSENTVVKYRSFGSDAQLVSEMVLAELEGLKESGIYGTLKHFPGHGATSSDTHEGYAAVMKTLEELQKCELLPFQAGIDAGAEFVMTGHISLPWILEDHTPASLSYVMTTEILRNQMGYDGIVITDALNMGAVSQMYSSAEAAIKAICAGADLILMPADFYSAYYGVLDAVERQEISEQRIEESMRRILKVKLEILDHEKNSEN